jgi:hypothetical protein
MKKRVLIIAGACLVSVAVAVLSYLGWKSFGADIRLFAGPAEMRLSRTGLYADVASRKLADNVMEFEPRYLLWSDGAEKHRFIYLPPGGRIDSANPDRWNFPTGTRLWKEFVQHGVLVETRMLLKTGAHAAAWDMAVYLWRPDHSDADKLMFARRDALATTHDVPAPRTCLQCHGNDAERRPLGFTQIQLPWTHAKLVSVSSLSAARRLSIPPTAEPVIPGDAQARAALGYLHANCGSCHYEGTGAVPKSVPLRLSLTTGALGNPAETQAYVTAIDARPKVPGLGTEVFIKPGDAQASLVWRRMGIRENFWRMPPIASEVVDTEGVALVRRWIESLDEWQAEVSRAHINGVSAE